MSSDRADHDGRDGRGPSHLAGAQAELELGTATSAEPAPGPAQERQGQTPTSSRRGGQYRSSRSTGYRAHSHYTPDELEERAKNAWYWTQLHPDGFNTKSELVVAGMTLICELLEDRYNAGQLFPPAPEQTRRGPSPAGAARQSAAMRAYWQRRSSTDPDDEPGPEEPVS